MRISLVTNVCNKIVNFEFQLSTARLRNGTTGRSATPSVDPGLCPGRGLSYESHRMEAKSALNCTKRGAAPDKSAKSGLMIKLQEVSLNDVKNTHSDV